MTQLNGYVANVPAGCTCGGCLDMKGASLPGTIEQDVGTTSGYNYDIKFEYSCITAGGGTFRVQLHHGRWRHQDHGRLLL